VVNSNVCEICTNTILTMDFRGTGVCGETCYKIRESQRVAQQNTLYLNGKAYPAKRIDWAMAPADVAPESLAALYGAGTTNGAAQLAQSSVEKVRPLPGKGRRKLGFIRRT
jgi:hypothetical protein